MGTLRLNKNSIDNYFVFLHNEKTKKILIDIEIDELINSIQNSVSGDIFDTKIFQLFSKDSRQINKTVLIKHYQDTLYATHFKGTKMIIETPAAIRLINQYFKNFRN